MTSVHTRFSCLDATSVFSNSKVQLKYMTSDAVLSTSRSSSENNIMQSRLCKRLIRTHIQVFIVRGRPLMAVLIITAIKNTGLYLTPGTGGTQHSVTYSWWISNYIQNIRQNVSSSVSTTDIFWLHFLSASSHSIWKKTRAKNFSSASKQRLKRRLQLGNSQIKKSPASLSPWLLFILV